jgi:CBS domain-containing protein
MNIASILAVKGETVVTIRPEGTVRQAISLLASHNIGAVVVVNEAGWPVGIVSERDIVRHAARTEQVFTQPIATIMTREVILGAPGDDLNSVGHTMTEKRIRHLPVVDSDRLVGIISIGDVVKTQRDQYLGELDTLQTQLMSGQS